MSIKETLQSNRFRVLLIGIGALIIMLLIFQAGVFIGYRKAAFSFQWGDNYYRTFQGRRGGSMMMGFPTDRDFSNSHGVVGKILKISLPTVIFEDRDGIEKVVKLDNNATIVHFRDTIKPSDLRVGDYAIVIGAPDDNAYIEAKFIRLLPSPPEMLSGTTTKLQ